MQIKIPRGALPRMAGMIVPIAAWHEEHVCFAQLLDLLEKEVQAFRGEGTPNHELMLDVVAYLRDYGDAFHHPRAELESAAATYLAYYRGHLAAEEEQILTRAALELTAEDWEAVRLAAPASSEARKSPGYYRELRRRIALEAV